MPNYRPPGKSELSKRFAKVDQKFWGELSLVAANPRLAEAGALFPQYAHRWQRIRAGTAQHHPKASPSEISALTDGALRYELRLLIGNRLKKTAPGEYIQRWLEIERELFPEPVESGIQEHVAKTTQFADDIEKSHASEKAQPGALGKKSSTFAETIESHWNRFANPASLTPEQQLEEIAKKKSEQAETQAWLEEKYDGIPLVRHLPVLKLANYLYKKYDRVNEYLARKELRLSKALLPGEGTDRRSIIDKLGPYTYAGYKTLDAVSGILSGLSLVSGIAAGIFGASAFFTGGVGAVPAAFCGVVALETGEWALGTKIAATALGSLSSLYQASLVERGLVHEDQAVEELKELNTSAITAGMEWAEHGKNVKELAEAKEKLARAKEIANRLQPGKVLTLGQRMGAFVDKLYAALTKPSQLMNALGHRMWSGLKSTADSIKKLPGAIMEWGGTLEKIHKWIERIRKAKEFLVHAGEAVVEGAEKLVGAGVDKVKSFGHSLWDKSVGLFHKGIDKTKHFAEGVAKKGSSLMGAVHAKLFPDVSEKDAAGATHVDGELTGPWYPQYGGHALYANANQALADGANVSLFINGVQTSYAQHARAAQELANQRNKPVVGIWNATGLNKGGFGFARDWAQSLGDKLGISENAATQTLKRVILEHGDLKDKKGGLDIYAHSQGSIIVSDALSQVRKEKGKKGIADIDVTTMGNAAATMPEGARSYRHFVFDADIIAGTVGSTSILNQIALGNPIGRWMLKKMGLRSTLQDTVTLHNDADPVRAHGVVPDPVQENGKDKIGADGKTVYDDKDYYIKALPRFEKKAETQHSPKSLLTTRQAMGMAFGTARGVGNYATGKVEQGYGKVSPLLRSMPIVPGVGLPGSLLDKSLRFGGNLLTKAGGMLGKAWDGLMGFQDPKEQPSTKSTDSGHKIQRRGSGAQPDADPDGLREKLVKEGGSGFAPPGNVREELGGHLGFDPGGARLHTGPHAATAARNLGAEAFTIGHDVFFGAGKFDMSSRQGMSLIAHELTHVMQQSAGADDKARRFSQRGGDEMEREAQQTAELYLANVGTPHGLMVENYAKVYETDSASHLGAADETRLDRISVRAVQRAGEILKARGRTDHTKIESVHVSVYIDLESMTDAEATEIWAEAIVQAIPAKTNRVSPEPPAYKVIQRYEGGEHKWLGDTAYKQAEHDLIEAKVAKLPKDQQNKERARLTKLLGDTMRLGLQNTEISYGSGVGLAGDFYESSAEMADPSFQAKDINDIVKLFETERDGALAGKVGDQYDSSNKWLAWHAPNFLVLATKNTSHFAGHNLEAYLKSHAEAIQTAVKAHSATDDQEKQKLWNLAKLQSAFADHFLTDSFSAGHMRVPRQEITDYFSALGISEIRSGYMAKILHDYDNQHGINVMNDRGDHWTAFGDTLLFADKDATKKGAYEAHDDQGAAKEAPADDKKTMRAATGRDIVLEATQTSVKELLSAFVDGQVPPQYGALPLIPYPEKDPKKKSADLVAVFNSKMSKEERDKLYEALPTGANRADVDVLIAHLQEFNAKFHANMQKDFKKDRDLDKIPPNLKESLVAPEPAGPAKDAAAVAEARAADINAILGSAWLDQGDVARVLVLCYSIKTQAELDAVKSKVDLSQIHMPDTRLQVWLALNRNITPPKKPKVKKQAAAGSPREGGSEEAEAERIGQAVQEGRPAVPPSAGQIPTAIQLHPGKDGKESDDDGDDTRIVGPTLPKTGPERAAGNTKVTPEVALEILKNLNEGKPPFKPELGKGGVSWFVTEGSPHAGIDAGKSLSIQVEIDKTPGALQFREPELMKIFNEKLVSTKAEAEATYRARINKATGPLNSAQRKSLQRFQEQFAETKMWDVVGEQVRNSPTQVGEVILENSQFSKSGNGKFGIVADASKVHIKGGPQALLETLQKAGTPAEAPVVEAAEALAAKMKWAGRVKSVFRYGGKVLIVVAIAQDAVKIYYAHDHVKAVVESAGGWIGATAAAEAFAAWWTPADVAGPWAWVAHGVGTLVSGGVGYWIGSGITRTVYELVAE